ncbi:aldehyde dehydrogenase [Sneathiella limimaris]|uniref:aldehyde dehydrogenase n=1 Tax=Sneathiella limimaris TaxID=1964213 RepID=UPI00146D57F8|nr:aldehyde dehydrogenase [Sneathiella limimaris]
MGVDFRFNFNNHDKLPIAGEWVLGKGEVLEIRNPASGELIGKLSCASSEQVTEALQAADRAYQSHDWASLLPHQRADYLFRSAELIADRADLLACLQSSENGKTFKESRGQALSAAGIVRYFASLCETQLDDIPPARGNYLTATVHEPFGVVAAITPWNSPLTMAAQKIAPALAAGNAVVLKPSELTSLVSMELARCFLDAGLPSGILNVVPGRGEIGQQLVESPLSGLISFTGGPGAGRSIAQTAAGLFKPVILELGGKSPNIVFADADLNAACKGVISAIFASGGQSCVAGSRLLVEQSIKDKFLEMLIEHAEGMKLGDPFDEESDIGPMASFQQRERVESYVALARQEGGEILTGGTRPTGGVYDKGAYLPPTIIDGLSSSSRVIQEEIFGGVLAICSFKSTEQAVALANDTVYGLAAGVWTQDYQKAWAVAKAIKAGTVWLNTYKQLSISAPFGGYGESGVGREKGVQGLRAYQQLKSIYLGGFEDGI